MANYFITSSYTSSISQSYATFSGSTTTISSSSIYYYNQPVNHLNVNWFEKTTSKFPSNGPNIYNKPSITWHFTNDKVEWLYDTTGSRDTEYNLTFGK